MNVTEIMDLLDSVKVDSLSILYGVDKVNTKITGKLILKLLVSSALKGYPLSLRSLEELCNTRREFNSLLKTNDESQRKIDHSSMGKRLETIKVEYFKDIYEDVVLKYGKNFVNQDHFHRFDSTMIKLSGKLLKDGLNCGGKVGDRYIKVSVSLTNAIPASVRFCKAKSEVSEDIALVKAINEAKVCKESILLFDRGITKAETFAEFTKNEQFFITRINPQRKYFLVETNTIITPEFTDTLELFSEEIINLYNKKSQKIDHNLRLIKGKNNKEEYWFLTNVNHLNTSEVVEAYKRRWDIEVLFKFLKQHLQFKHFISHNNNGMSVYIYCLLIAAILFMAYKKTNNLIGYKIAMLRFILELEKEIIKDIVIFCGGDPNLISLRL